MATGDRYPDLALRIVSPFFLVIGSSSYDFKFAAIMVTEKKNL